MGWVQKLSGIAAERIPDIPFLAYDGDYTIWQLGNLATPRPVPITSYSTSLGDYQADPMRSPIQDPQGIPTEFVYCNVRAGTGPVNELIVCEWDGSSKTVITTSPGNNGVTGVSTSLQPAWSPDGQQIVWVDTEADHVTPTVPRSIRVIDRDGSNETIILSGTAIYTPTYAESDDFWSPQYSYDGSKIAFMREKGITDTGVPSNSGTYCTLEVMNSDGTGVQVVAGPLHATGLGKRLMSRYFAWANTDLVLAYMTWDGFAKTDDQYWRRVNADSTGAAVIWQIDRSTRTLFDYDPEPINWSWLSDDSDVATLLADFGGTGLGDLVVLDAAGGGPTTLLAGVETNVTGEDFRPVCIGGRIYFPTDAFPITQIDSVLEDGTDRRTDLLGSDFSPTTEFLGFRGDDLTS